MERRDWNVILYLWYFELYYDIYSAHFIQPCPSSFELFDTSGPSTGFDAIYHTQVLGLTNASSLNMSFGDAKSGNIWLASGVITLSSLIVVESS